MTVAKLNFEYQETDRPLMVFYRQPWDKADPTANIWEDIAFEGWVKQANNPEKGYRVPRAKERGIFVSSGEIPVEYISGHYKFTKEINPQVPIGKIGYYLSLVENFRQDLLNMVYDEKGELNQEMVKYIEFLRSKGLKDPMDVPIIGVEDMEDAYARIYFDFEKVALVAHKDIYTDKAKQLLGTDDPKAIDELVQDFMRHELAHIFGVHSEKGVGELMAEFYESRAKALGNTKLGNIYRALAEQARAYANDRIWYNRLADELAKDIEAGIDTELTESDLEALIAEAIEDGCETEGEVADYVRSRVNGKESDAESEETGDYKAREQDGEAEDEATEYSNEAGEAEAGDGDG